MVRFVFVLLVQRGALLVQGGLFFPWLRGWWFSCWCGDVFLLLLLYISKLLGNSNLQVLVVNLLGNSREFQLAGYWFPGRY